MSPTSKAKPRQGCGLRLFLTVLLAFALFVLALVWAYRVLDEGGAFSPTKCVENGGRWDDSIEVCNFD